MAVKALEPLAEWYQERIGTPSTGGEVLGSRLFALGIVLGVLGLVQFFFFSYSRRSGARDAVDRVKRHAAGAEDAAVES